MRRAIFVFFCLVLAVSMVAIPADTMSAKPASSLELSAPSPAQLEEEKDQVDDILEELKEARGYTDDKKIRGQIDDVRNMVIAAWKYEKAGDSELALAMKYRIAKHLEQLINELPAASPGMTTAAAAIPQENPLYEELLEVRGKIDVLIDMELERVPEGVTPIIPEIQRVTEPEIKRPPEMERLIVYSAKFLCGPAFGGEGVQPGSYSTAINVHNPQEQTVYLFKKVVIAEPEYKPRGQISAFRKVRLAPDEAIEIDCLDIGTFFRPQPEPGRPTEEGRPSLTLAPTYAENMVGEHHKLVATVRDANGNPVAGAEVSFHFLETGSTPVRPTDANGQAVLEHSSPDEGKDTIVAAVTVNGHKLEATATKLWTSKPTEEAKCPQGCECMTEAAAEESGFRKCQNQRIQCGSTVSTTTPATAATTVPMYCYQKPTEEEEPSTIPPGEVDVQCPEGCKCYTKAEADERGYTSWCQNQTTPCGTDTAGNQRYCFEKPAGKSGLSRIASAMPEETGLAAPSEQTGTTLSTSPVSIMEIDRPIRFIKGFVVIYSTAPLDVVGVYTASTAFGFSLDVEYLQPSSRGVRPILIPDEPEEPPPTEVGCPYPCECLTRDEAREYGLTALCQETQIPCAWDAQHNPTKFCFERPEEPPPTEPCPDACKCVTQREAELLLQQGWNWCYGKEWWVCGYEDNGEEMYCLGPPEEEPEPTETQCPRGCYCLTENEGYGRGYEPCQEREMPCAWDQYQKPTKFCFQEPEQPPPTQTQCPTGCECMDPKRALGAGYDWCLRNGDEIPCGNGQYCFRKPTQDLKTPPLQLR